MKKSRFNLIVPYKDSKTIIFNTRSGGIGLFDKEFMNRYESGTMSVEEKKALAHRGMLVHPCKDELSEVNADRLEGIVARGVKEYRIWTTSACNARCFYCFEKGIRAEAMSEETANRVADVIEESLEDGDQLYVEWFGGEPLCNMGVIDCLTRRLDAICSERHANYHASMVTNGSLVTQEVAHKIAFEWHVEKIQVTLDGYTMQYEAIKNYKDPESHNFRAVVSGIQHLLDAGVRVSLRMNYTTDNYASLSELIDFLHCEFGGAKGIHYYAYPIWGSLNAADPNAFVSDTKADENLINLFDKMLEYDMEDPRSLVRLRYRRHQCGACRLGSFTILPDGLITKCSEAFSHPIGDIWGGVADYKTQSIWTDGTVDGMCYECVYLPICQGGCKASKCAGMEQCFAYKPIYPRLISWYMDYLIEKKRENG